MKVQKKVLGQLERVYATSIQIIDNKINYFTATEGKGSCLRFNEKLESDVVWDGPGGTMNIVPIPRREGEFFATQKFFPTFNAKESCIVYCKLNENNSWDIQHVMDFPYLHRFDVIDVNGDLYFIGATLCTDKDFQDDWSKPGKVYVGKLSDTMSDPISVRPVIEGITKNHGFCNGKWNGRRAVFVTGVEGVFVIYVPENENENWEYEKLFDYEVSDTAVCDIDADGELEIATIEGFHGDKGIIYKNIDGKLTKIYEYPFEFGHVIWGGTLLNKPAFIIAGRKGKMELVAFQMDENKNIKPFIIDNTGGPSNISVINQKDKDIILAANRQVGEIAIYELTK